jgi:hypothetical protein
LGYADLAAQWLPMEIEMATLALPHLRDAVFEPDDTQALAVAFDEICRAMNLPVSATVAREVVAIRVIDLAREGLLDPAILRNRVLYEARMGRQLLPESETAPPSMWPWLPLHRFNCGTDAQNYRRSGAMICGVPVVLDPVEFINPVEPVVSLLAPLLGWFG